MKPSKYGQDQKDLQQNKHQQKLDAGELVSPDFSPPFNNKAIPENAVVGVLKSDGQILEASSAFCDIFSIKNAGKGENFLNYLSSSDRSLLSRKFLLASHHNREYEAQLMLPAGDKQQTIHLKVRIQRDRVVLEELKPEVEKISKSSLRNPSSFLEKIPLAALLYNSRFQFQQANGRLLKFAGYQDQHEFQAQPEEMLFPGQSLAFSHLRAELEKPDQESKEAKTLLCLKTKEGKQKWVQLSMSFVAEGLEVGSPPVYLALLQDVSELKEQESQLLKQQDEMDIFMDRAFHDLKGPINSLLALYNLLEHEFGQDEKVMEYVKHYHQGISRLHRVLHDLLILSRIKKAEPRPKNVSLHQMVDDCLDSFKNLPHFFHIRFIKNLHVPQELFIEESLLQTIVQNLLENAIKYCSEKDPEVKIEGSLENDHLKLQVSDNGIGIPEDLQQRVFERFFRATEKASGSGLGLYLLQQALLKLNGSVSLKSREGHGTTFSVLIPAKHFSQGADL